MKEFTEHLTAVFGDEEEDQQEGSIFDEPEMGGMILNTLLPPDSFRLAPAA